MVGGGEAGMDRYPPIYLILRKFIKKSLDKYQRIVTFICIAMVREKEMRDDKAQEGAIRPDQDR